MDKIYLDLSKPESKLSPTYKPFKQFKASDVKFSETQKVYISLDYLKKLTQEQIQKLINE